MPCPGPSDPSFRLPPSKRGPGTPRADTAAHLGDRVLPEAPVRQWVLSLPFALRYRLAWDARLVNDVLQLFVRAVFGSLRRRAGNHRGIPKARRGAGP